MLDAAAAVHERSEQQLHPNVAKVIVVEVHMSQRWHLRELRELGDVRRAQVEMLQVHRRGNGEEVGHIHIAGQTDGRLCPGHDVAMCQLGIVLPVKGSEAAVKPLPVDVVHVQSLRHAFALLPFPLFGGLLLQLLLGGAEAVHCRGPRCTRRDKGFVSGSRQNLLTARNGRHHGHPKLRQNGAGFEEPAGGVDLRLQLGCHSRQASAGHRRGEGAVVAAGRIGMLWWPAPHFAEAVILQQLGRNHDVHVAVGNVLEMVHHPSKKVHVAL
mmetsp:Transcript_119171/g.282799  ORF Transcript_119171/g.282799 Transcript_119171/m.282799 type:complete len:269 (-) Transcript_119171:1506-2312(-)